MNLLLLASDKLGMNKAFRINFSAYIFVDIRKYRGVGVLKSKFFKKTKRICIKNPKFSVASIYKINLSSLI